MGSDNDLERGSADRPTDRDDLRQRRSHRQGRLQSHRRPTPTPQQPPQVRCPHPTSTRLTDLGWHKAKITSQGELIFRDFPAKDRIGSIGLSPQSRIAAQFKPILADERKMNRWETVMIDLVDAILREPEIDPILQVALLRKVVEAAVEGSEPLRKALEAMKNQLDQVAVDVNVPWM